MLFMLALSENILRTLAESTENISLWNNLYMIPLAVCTVPSLFIRICVHSSALMDIHWTINANNIKIFFIVQRTKRNPRNPSLYFKFLPILYDTRQLLMAVFAQPPLSTFLVPEAAPTGSVTIWES